MHSVVLVLVGGYVVFKGVVPVTPFVAVDRIDTGLDEVVMPEPTDLPEVPDFPSLNQDFSSEPAAQGETTSSDILVSTATQVPFSLPPAVGAPTPVPTLGTGAGGTAETGGGGPTPVRKGNIVRSLFGNSEATPTAFVGTLYDLKQKKGGGSADMIRFLKEFADSGFQRALLRDFYAAETRLYATQFFLPQISAAEAPRSFQVEKEVQPKNWIAFYEGRFAAPKTGRYRFVGQGDDVLIVRVNSKVVFDGSIITGNGGSLTGWKPGPGQIEKSQGPVAYIPLVYGDWMDLEKGVNNPTQVVLGEMPGENFCAYLFIEQEGVAYARDGRRGQAPVLPIFRVEDKKDDWSGFAPHLIPAYLKEGPVFKPNPKEG
jgi:hypothetical protein